MAVILPPTAKGEAPKGLPWTGDPRFQSFWTLAGTPCITVPAGTGSNGLPLGIQVTGLRYTDDRLFSLAAWVQDRLE